MFSRFHHVTKPVHTDVVKRTCVASLITLALTGNRMKLMIKIHNCASHRPKRRNVEIGRRRRQKEKVQGTEKYLPVPADRPART